MHVVMLSDSETFGGAAIAASRLAEAMVQASVRVTRIVGIADGMEHEWGTYMVGAQLREKVILKALEVASRRLANFARTRLASQRLRHLLMKLSPDVINVHNLHSAGWSPDLLEVCAHHAPTVWTLHDMWSFTGRCAYSYGCRKFLTNCDASCPTPTERPALSLDRIAGAWRRREKLLAKFPGLIAVTPSRWLAQKATCGLWKGHGVEVIPNGLPLEVYRPVEKKVARMALGIERPAPVVLTAAHNLNERRKGGGILVEALQKVSIRPFTLLTFGHGFLPVKMEDIRIHQLGYVNPERVKVLAYNAADIFVHPAPVDNLPNVVIEAIACGTPVVGFATGGVPEMVLPRQTGWLVNEVSPEALAKEIDTAIADLRNGVDLQESCRAIAEVQYSSNLQARRYLDLFESL